MIHGPWWAQVILYGTFGFIVWQAAWWPREWLGQWLAHRKVNKMIRRNGGRLP